VTEPLKNKDLSIKPAFERATLDRNMTVNVAPVAAALAKLDLQGLAVLDFGCGNGNILRLLRATQADTVYAFEVMPQFLDQDIKDWANDTQAKPRLVINPPEFKVDPALPDGDLTNYDYFKLLAPHAQFGIVSNPPYFLYNRILSLTGDNLGPGQESYATFKNKFAGGLMITSEGRLQNHPGWIIKAVMPPEDFNPPAFNAQYLLQTGFGKAAEKNETVIVKTERSQQYFAINNRAADIDNTDCYPDMWHQLNSLRLG